MAGAGRSPKTVLFQRPFGPWTQRLVVAATAAYAAVLMFATHYPKPEELVGGRLPSDKLMHFVAYGVLGFLAALVLRSRGRLVARFAPLLAAGLAGWCVIDEATQPLFGRHADPLDWVYDVIGLAVGIGAVVAATQFFAGREARRAG
jgi:VanZ family protein